MSGLIEVPDQEPTIDTHQPEINGKLIHNSETNYSNKGNTYTVVDSYGSDAFEIYYGADYTSLEEVVAYIYAWGDVPVNYVENKSESPLHSPWSEYLRLNNSQFTGDVDKYPYEPELPGIYGIGDRNLLYYEIDIGTTEKRFDIVFVKDKHVYACECNFYGGGGSKLNETARSYKTLALEVKDIPNFTFVWFTDETSWNFAKHNLEETFSVLDTIYNLNDLENYFLTNLEVKHVL